MEKESVESNGEKIYFYVQRKDVKNINLKVNIDKKVTLSIPMKMSLDKAKDFVKKKANWIKKQQDFYDTFAEQKENITFEDGETVYLLGKQYKMKIVSDNSNNVVINNKYIEIHIKEKYIDNKKNQRYNCTISNNTIISFLYYLNVIKYLIDFKVIKKGDYYD